MRIEKGFTLVEAITFLVVLSIGFLVLIKVFSQSVSHSVDPVMRLKALEKGQAVMDEILARKFDENTPTGGIPACDSELGEACAGITGDSDFDDVGDYHGYSDSSEAGFNLSVNVVNAGGDLGIDAAHARLITVQVNMPDGNAIHLSAYKVNF